MRKWMRATLRTGLLMAACVAVAAPAWAQLGSVQGQVVDEDGNPVAGATIIYEFYGERDYRFEGESNEDGEFTRAGLFAVGGYWMIMAETETAAGFVSNIEVPIGDVVDDITITVRQGFALPDSTADLSVAEAEERNARMAELRSIFAEVTLALETGDYASALTALQAAADRVEGCAECYLRMGDVHFDQGSYEESEEAYNTAIEYDENSAQAYDGLAALYNSQQRFAEAGEASAKAAEIRSLTGEFQDATSLFNAGAILVNSGDMTAAQKQFEAAIAADPQMAEAHYQLAMTHINQGNIAEAIPALEQYLSLAPDGPNAPTAEMMLPELEKMLSQ